ncbi:histamine H2 receptor-like [Paramuricea clavata]|uniref:Histamine H2 receptor-like n=1 Tax=Paramuricea clavata TaxID=317549 RepID=A0A6S7GHV2_PARCT|nr:histamine H2 receptor-like [Paramuricea clavata]
MFDTFEERCRSIKPPTEMSFITGGVTILLILTNIPGNILVILAVVLDPNKNLRTPFNWLVVNLAAADIMVGIIAQPLAVYFHITEGLEDGVDAEESIAIYIVYFTSCTASILSVSSLAVERYLAVRKPNTYRTKVTNKRILLTIAMIWVISLSLPNINLNVGFSTYAFIFTNSSVVVGVIIICRTYTLVKHKVSMSEMRSHHGRCRSILLTLGEGGNKPSQHESPSAVITETDYPNARTQNRHSFEQNTPSTSTEKNLPSQVRSPLPTVNTTISSSNAITSSRQLLEAKVTKIFLIVLVALLCCYGPSTILIYVVSFCEDCSCTTLHCLEDISVLFTFMNSSINFFCYALRSSRFRNSFLKLLRMNRRRNFSSSFNAAIAQ